MLGETILDAHRWEIQHLKRQSHENTYLLVLLVCLVPLFYTGLALFFWNQIGSQIAEHSLLGALTGAMFFFSVFCVLRRKITRFRSVFKFLSCVCYLHFVAFLSCYERRRIFLCVFLVFDLALAYLFTLVPVREFFRRMEREEREDEKSVDSDDSIIRIA